MASNDDVGRFAGAGRRRGAGMCVGGAVLCLVAAGAALAQDTPMSIIAAQVRIQGHTCNDPRRAERDMQASRPNETVWTLTCENATYRVTLVPDMAARIEVKK
jgi:hypothetical protein